MAPVHLPLKAVSTGAGSGSGRGVLRVRGPHHDSGDPQASLRLHVLTACRDMGRQLRSSESLSGDDFVESEA